MQLLENLKKPDDKKWKRIADWLLYTGLPAINGFFLAVQPVSPEFTIWALALSSMAIALFKGSTKFTTQTDDNQV